MRRFVLLILSVCFIAFLVSCEKSELENETGIEFKSIEKEDVEALGGQSGN
ncbi:hypothetical protein [Aquimarina sp. 2304DJ70-9]|uniref:hypothetical protein n=1 Tax=Aquimarina penaris TaxID=3231044 RepID=UPI0034632BCC